MTYANRAMYDADSHIMELPDFLQKYADPAMRDEIPAVSYSASIVTDEEVAEIMARGGRHSDAHLAELLGLGDRLIEKSKEIQALGAFDGAERKTAMDMLGFKKQLVFATHSVAMPFSPSSKITPQRRYAGARAHNRHMIDFCSHDDRLMGVAIVPLDDPRLCPGRARLRPEVEPEGRMGAASSLRRQIAGSCRVRAVLGQTGRSGRAVPSACRWLAAAAGQGMGQQRPRRDQGLAGRRREPAHQGCGCPAPGPGDVYIHDGDRGRLRALPEACAAQASSSARAGCRRC